jgi:hypothetical protein
MREKKICKNCKYWKASPILVDLKKVFKFKDPAINAILKKLTGYRAKSVECTRRSPSFTISEYEQWSAVQNDDFCDKFERKDEFII